MLMGSVSVRWLGFAADLRRRRWWRWVVYRTRDRWRERAIFESTHAAGIPSASFPGGETLGLPPGMTIPGPLSWQALLGLWDWNCAGGICVPGFGIAGARPAWLNNVTSVFGYDQNIPLQSCFVDVFLKGTAKNFVDSFNPFSPDAGAAAGTYAKYLGFNAALKYAATTPSKTFGTPNLLYPFKSSSFRNLLKGAEKAGPKASLIANADIAGVLALQEEWDAIQADTHRLHILDNFNPNLPAGKVSALQECNQHLCDRTRGSLIDKYFSGPGSPFGGRCR